MMAAPGITNDAVFVDTDWWFLRQGVSEQKLQDGWRDARTVGIHQGKLREMQSQPRGETMWAGRAQAMGVGLPKPMGSHIRT